MADRPAALRCTSTGSLPRSEPRSWPSVGAFHAGEGAVAELSANVRLGGPARTGDPRAHVRGGRRTGVARRSPGRCRHGDAAFTSLITAQHALIRGATALSCRCFGSVVASRAIVSDYRHGEDENRGRESRYRDRPAPMAVWSRRRHSLCAILTGADQLSRRPHRPGTVHDPHRQRFA